MKSNINNEDFGKKILEIQDSERNRIANEIHDSIVQNLISISHKAELSMKLVDVDPIRTKLELETMIKSIKQSITDMREVIFDLKPMMIDDIGLKESIQKHINRLMYKENIDIELVINNEEYELTSLMNITIFQLIQEACVNVIKHANASKIIISLTYNKDNIIVCVVDDGIGININDSDCMKEDLSGLGISIMKERVYLLNGKISFKSQNEGGTKVEIILPVSNN